MPSTVLMRANIPQVGRLAARKSTLRFKNLILPTSPFMDGGVFSTCPSRLPALVYQRSLGLSASR